MEKLFNFDYIEKLIEENEEFAELFASIVRRIGAYLHACEMSYLGRSAEWCFIHAEQVANSRQKIVNMLLFANKTYSTEEEKIFLQYVRNIKASFVQDELIETFYFQVWERDLLDNKRVKEILSHIR